MDGPVKEVCLFLHNGMWRYFKNHGFGFRVRTIQDTPEEDYKTALVKNIPDIPKDTLLEIKNVFTNCYGTFLTVFWGGRMYSIDPRKVDGISIPSKSEESEKINKKKVS